MKDYINFRNDMLNEQESNYEKFMLKMRAIAKLIVQNIMILPQVGDEIVWDNNRIVVHELTQCNNNYEYIEVEIITNEISIGTIFIDYISESPRILVGYDLCYKYEKFGNHSQKKEILQHESKIISDIPLTDIKK